MKTLAVLFVSLIGVALHAQDLGVAIGSQQASGTLLTAFAFGGTAPYTYTWVGGAQGRLLTVDRPGRYTVVVTDAAGRTTKASIRVKKNTELAREHRQLARTRRFATVHSDLWVNERDSYFIGGQYTGQPIRNDGPSHSHRTVVP